MEIMSEIQCQYQDSCSGCAHWGRPYVTQKSLKEQHLRDLLQQHHITPPPQINFQSAGASHLRDRLDFSLHEGRLGLFAKNEKKILDLEICAQLSPALQEWLTEFRRIQWPVQKGSIRLRVGPQGQKGVWLDFANIDIKKILDEKKILKHLQSLAFVEMGQRRKVPMWTGTEFKLQDPQLNIWFQTRLNNQAVNLYCHVASFTQPSLKANQQICATLTTWMSSLKNTRIIEFGSGIGNLTLPLLSSASSLLACEIDRLSLEGLEKTLTSLPEELQGFRDKVSIHAGDFQQKLLQDFSQFDIVVANPPRSGLKKFIDPLGELKAAERPRYFIYMSCFPESLAHDLGRLQSFGYEIQKLAIVDQFPQTDHYEVLTLLERKERES